MDSGVGFGHGHVIHKGDGLGSNAQEVVDVHGHAIDANATPLFQGCGDLKFAPHTVGGKGEQVVAKFNQATKPTGQVDRCTGRSRGSHALGERTDE